jgi:diacylglycerol kinase (ATP)
LELAVLGPQLLLGTHLESELIHFRRASKITVRSEPGMWFNVDGELISNAPAQFEVLPRVLQVIVGPTASSPETT